MTTESQGSKAFIRDRCEEHDKTLYHSRHDAVGSLVGGMKGKRVRVYPCDAHKGRVHLTKESRKYHY